MSRLDPVKRVLEETPAVRLAVVFGSAARGSEAPGSDLDLAVSVPGLGARAVSVLTVELERAADRRIDLVLLDEAPPLLRFEIARDGILLLEHLPHAWTDFRARAMIDWWDWAPTARMMHRVMAEKVKEEARRGGA